MEHCDTRAHPYILWLFLSLSINLPTISLLPCGSLVYDHAIRMLVAEERTTLWL